MMKNLLKTILVVLFFTSCNSQNDMDLINLNLPIPKDILINKNYKTEVINTLAKLQGYVVYKSTDPNLLIINGEKISGRFSENDDSNVNNIQFHVHQERKDISYININSFTTEKTKLLHEILLEKFGEPDYYKSSASMSHSIWENRATDDIYLYTHKYRGKINGILVERGVLHKIDINNEELMKYFTRTGFSFYKDYIDNRTNKDKNYTYKVFAKELNDKGVDRYLKAIENPVKH